MEHSIKREVLYDGLLDEQVTLEELRLTIISRLPDGSAPGQDGIFQEQVNIRQCILLEYLV